MQIRYSFARVDFLQMSTYYDRLHFQYQPACEKLMQMRPRFVILAYYKQRGD
jgi:hypothetical protein